MGLTPDSKIELVKDPRTLTIIPVVDGEYAEWIGVEAVYRNAKRLHGDKLWIDPDDFYQAYGLVSMALTCTDYSAWRRIIKNSTMHPQAILPSVGTFIWGAILKGDLWIIANALRMQALFRDQVPLLNKRLSRSLIRDIAATIKPVTDEELFQLEMHSLWESTEAFNEL